MTETDPSARTQVSRIFSQNPTSIVDTSRLVTLAISLLRKGARTAIVNEVTGISKNLTRQICRELAGIKPSNGLIPRDAEWPAKTLANNMHTSLFIHIYAEINTKCHNPPNKAEVFSASYSAYEKTVDLTLININRAWRIAQQYTDGEIQMRQCPQCRIGYVLVKSMPKEYHLCPHCETPIKMTPCSDIELIRHHLLLAGKRRLTSSD